MKIGKYWTPTNRLGTLLEATTIIYDNYGGKEINADLIAAALKHSSNSGTFKTKLADLKTYGLIEGRGQQLTVTELAKQATFGEQAEKAEALRKIIWNVDLWRELWDSYATSIKKENFWAVLVKITGEERSIAQKKAESIRKVYLEAVEYIESAGEPVETPLELGAESSEAVGRISNMEAQPTTVSKAAILYIKYPDRSETRYEIKNEKDYQVGETLFKSIRSKLGLTEGGEEDKELAAKILEAVQSVLDVRKKDADENAALGKGEQ